MRAVPFASHGLANVPSPAVSGGQSCTGAAGGGGGGGTAATLIAADGGAATTEALADGAAEEPFSSAQPATNVMKDAAKTALEVWDRINIVGPFPSRLPDRNTRKAATYLPPQKPSIGSSVLIKGWGA